MASQFYKMRKLKSIYDLFQTQRVQFNIIVSICPSMENVRKDRQMNDRSKKGGGVHYRLENSVHNLCRVIFAR